MILQPKFRNPSILDGFLQNFNFLRAFFAWWYGDIPIFLLSLLKRTFTVLNDTTSFSIIIGGFLKPWKNDYNIAGWLVGIVIKTVYLPIILIIFIALLLIFVVLLTIQLTILPIIIGLIIINPFLIA